MAYHGLWQTLRLLGMGATLGGHPERYHAVLGDLVQRHRRGTSLDDSPSEWPISLLIAGAADYSMLAHVIDAASSAWRQLDITVIDQCPTPLLMNEWYADRLVVKITTRCADILTQRLPEQFDIIVTSSFLGYFDPARRTALFDALAAMLKPGGSFVSSNRLRSEDPNSPLARSHAACLAFAERVVASQSVLPAGCRRDEALFEQAYEYARRRRPFPLNDMATLVRLASHAGLDIERLERITSVQEASGVSGPTLQDGSPYAFFVMTRP
ncbi:class I SAM-dependent methyltransferase [Halomonas lysinitropha]|uniref:Methyltransferase domain-containing protein n=1 Tax=Halomonas lysinitropha TaxID=2607506 RepID=A0A5K1I504_9GAMM|nr:class I SAM-dependent methyltransferase [Halomonas lysinitropha]VVZ95278.1 hypothetical protein HALO32_01343 [Halomonas lysinitropha]